MEYPISPVQALLDGMSAAWQKERSATQMTLGRLISTLEGMDKSRIVSGFGVAHSYRGYYSDLSFEPDQNARETVADLLARCRSCMGREFTGYKGGDFLMGESTPLWMAEYGCCGDRLMGLNGGERVVVPVTSPDPEA